MLLSRDVAQCSDMLHQYICVRQASPSTVRLASAGNIRTKLSRRTASFVMSTEVSTERTGGPTYISLKSNENVARLIQFTAVIVNSNAFRILGSEIIFNNSRLKLYILSIIIVLQFQAVGLPNAEGDFLFLGLVVGLPNDLVLLCLVLTRTRS